MEQPQPIAEAPLVTDGGIERLETVANLMSRVFVNDPLITYIFLKLSREERVGFLETYFLRAINSVALNGAIITEANGWCAAAVMVPPGSTWSDFRTKSQTGMLSVARKIGFRGCWRLMTEIGPKAHAAMRKGFPHNELAAYYYLFAIGTEVQHQRRGLARAIMRYYQNMAERDKMPIYLEASTWEAHRLYQSLGFSVVDTLVLGKKKVGADGSRQSNGPGIVVWAMMWRPMSGLVA